MAQTTSSGGYITADPHRLNAEAEAVYSATTQLVAELGNAMSQLRATVGAPSLGNVGGLAEAWDDFAGVWTAEYGYIEKSLANCLDLFRRSGEMYDRYEELNRMMWEGGQPGGSRARSDE